MSYIGLHAQPVENTSIYGDYPVRAVQDQDIWYAAGETISTAEALQSRLYLIREGEVVIQRQGRPVDLIEEGEFLDESIWQGVEVVAWRDCRLARIHNGSNRRPRVLASH